MWEFEEKTYTTSVVNSIKTKKAVNKLVNLFRHSLKLNFAKYNFVFFKSQKFFYNCCGASLCQRFKLANI